MNPNQILFATDFSDRDLEAFNSSCKLAFAWKAKLHIVHVQDPRETVKPRDQRTDPNREFARFIPKDISIDFTQHVLVGDAADEILRYAEEKDVTLIVLGTHGREGVERIFSGSVAETIMRKSQCPVMTSRTKHSRSDNQKLARILVPVDFSAYSYAALDFASRLALTTSAELTICYVEEENDPTIAGLFSGSDPEPNEHREHVTEQLVMYKPTISKVHFTHKLFKGEPGEAICNYANSNRYDYIVLGTHGRTGLTRAIMGSVAEYVVRHSDCPVISVKLSDKRTRLVS